MICSLPSLSSACFFSFFSDVRLVRLDMPVFVLFARAKCFVVRYEECVVVQGQVDPRTVSGHVPKSKTMYEHHVGSSESKSVDP